MPSRTPFDELCERDPEFRARFGTEEACRSWLYRVRWPTGFRCPHCGGTGYSLSRGNFECATCGKQTSLIAGTLFENTKKPIQLWLKVVLWLIAHGGANAKQLERTFQVNHKTAWTWCHKIRSAMQRKVMRTPRDIPMKDLAELAPRERDRALARWRTRGFLRLFWQRPGTNAGTRGQPSCCRRLDAFDWLVPVNWEDDVEGRSYNRWRRESWVATNDERDPLPSHDESDSSALRFRLASIFSGGISERHLQSYLDEAAFLANRRDRPDRIVLETLFALMVHAPPRPYADIARSRALDVRRKITIEAEPVFSAFRSCAPRRRSSGPRSTSRGSRGRSSSSCCRSSAARRVPTRRLLARISSWSPT